MPSGERGSNCLLSGAILCREEASNITLNYAGNAIHVLHSCLRRYNNRENPGVMEGRVESACGAITCCVEEQQGIKHLEVRRMTGLARKVGVEECGRVRRGECGFPRSRVGRLLVICGHYRTMDDLDTPWRKNVRVSGRRRSCTKGRSAEISNATPNAS